MLASTATANQLLMASGYQPMDKFGFDADDYAAVEKFLNETEKPNDCPCAECTPEFPDFDDDDPVITGRWDSIFN